MSNIDFNRLQAHFSIEDISWKPQVSGFTGKGTPYCLLVPFIQKKPLQDRLDEVCGPGNWKFIVREIKDGFLGAISIFINDVWVDKWDGGKETNIEPIKGGVTDSFKRSAIQWNVCNCRALNDMGEMFGAVAQKNDTNQQGFKAIPVKCKKDKQDHGKTFFFLPPLIPEKFLKETKPQNTGTKTKSQPTKKKTGSSPQIKEPSLNDKIKAEYSRLLGIVEVIGKEEKNKYIAETRDVIMMKIGSDKKSVDHLKNDEKESYLDTLINYVNSIEEAKSFKKTG